MRRDAQTFADLVSARVTELGGKVSAIEARFNLTPDAIRNVIRTKKNSGPTLSRAQEICEALDIELYLGPPRKPDMQVPSSGSENSAVDDFELVQRWDAKLSAGPGALGDNAKPLAPLAFRRDWLRDLYLSAKDCMVVNVGGDSMYPTLRDGDLALIDRRPVSDLSYGHIYALVDSDGQLRVKRIEVIDEGLLLQSDNAEYSVEPRLGEEGGRVKILGRVVWSGHKHEISLRKPPKTDKPRSKRSKPDFKPSWL